MIVLFAGGSMTKKLFEAFAAAIRRELDDSQGTGFVAEMHSKCRFAAELFADIAARENGKFDRERFMDACGL